MMPLPWISSPNPYARSASESALRRSKAGCPHAAWEARRGSRPPTGQVAFDNDGYGHRNGAVTLQLKKGQPVIAWLPELATGGVQYPSPAW